MIIKTISVIIVLAILLLFSGCVTIASDKTIYLDKSTNQTLTLYKDLTFEEEESTGTYSGTYRIDGDHVKLTFKMFGLVADLKKEGGNLTYRGTTWQKVQ